MLGIDLLYSMGAKGHRYSTCTGVQICRKPPNKWDRDGGGRARTTGCRGDGERSGQPIETETGTGPIETRMAAARTGTGDDGRGELEAAITSRGSVKPALIPC
jgi:hypothetical protein